MIDLILRMWNWIPIQYRLCVAIVLGAVVLLVIGFCVYKIQDWGYERCEAKHVAASIKLKEKSREEIIEAEKQYEKIKTKIIRIQGDNGIAGPRTQFAIDSMPIPSGR